MAIDLAARRIDDMQVAGLMVEFPRADDRRGATPTRYVYAPTLTPSFGPAPVAGTFNTMARTIREFRAAGTARLLRAQRRWLMKSNSISRILRPTEIGDVPSPRAVT